MDPERGSEPEAVEVTNHPPGVRELVRVKLCVTITTLPVVINLKMAVIESIIDYIPETFSVQYYESLTMCATLQSPE